MKFHYVCSVPTLESSVTFNGWMSLATALFVWCGYYEGSYLESHVRFTAVPSTESVHETDLQIGM